MERSKSYEEQAAYCTYLLRRVLAPARRAQIERERQDWLMLSYQRRLWSELETQGAAPSDRPRRALEGGQAGRAVDSAA